MAHLGHFYIILVVLLQYTITGQQHQCPLVCECYDEGEKLKVSCPNRGLIELPEEIIEDVETLDLSNNEFQQFPNLARFTVLDELDISGNFLKTLPNNALTNMLELEVLNLAANRFSSWLDINPNSLLLPAGNLRYLDISDNDWKIFANLEDSEILVSPSVEVLVLRQSNINSIHGNSPIRGLTALKRLDLSQNPVQRIRQITSETLEELDLSYCELSYIYHDELLDLPSLRTLNLSNNYRLLISSNIGTLNSNSLSELDLSYCNLAEPFIEGFPNLMIVSLRGNAIGTLNHRQFVNNSLIEEIDLSTNSISEINTHAFQSMTQLKKLNLSMNYINNIPESTFSATPKLTTLLLYRNYLNTVVKLTASSLEYLDLSMCEIIDFKADDLTGLPSLLQINLSKNLIMHMPNNLQLPYLKVLDISYNRLTSLHNNTFISLPNLEVLRMQSNRFSTIWRMELFRSNSKLKEITIDDNPWRCDCNDVDMKEFYEFLTGEHTKVKSNYDLLCETPVEYAKYTWSETCMHTWYSTLGTSEDLQENERVTMFIIVMFATFAICMCILWAIRKAMNAKLKNARLERARLAEEERDRLRLLRIQREQEAHENAPDPRELVAPPSYAEALTMPRIDGSFHSLAGVGTGSGRSKRRRRRRTKSSGDLLDMNTQTDDSLANGRPMSPRITLTRLEHSPSPRRRSLDNGNVHVIRVDADIERGPSSRRNSEQINRESDL